MFLQKILKIPIYFLAAICVLIIRIIRPIILVRIAGLISTRIGHFAANTELYLCEHDAGINVPSQRYIDFFYLTKPISNYQLANMWRRVLLIGPTWLLSRIDRINRLTPGGKVHNAFTKTTALDIHNLLDQFPPHISFTKEEQILGESNLIKMGIPVGARFVCLIARDQTYLESVQPRIDFKYHNYRNSDIDNYVLAAEELANRGYFVIRMGSIVKKTIKSNNHKIIDYATNGMRSDFMDIYLGRYCTFCISSGTGWDAIPEIFRRPIVYVNFVPLGHIHTFRSEFLSITKRHVLLETKTLMRISEILSSGIGFYLKASDFENVNIELIENTPEEIYDVVIEMEERLTGKWIEHEDDKILQQKFWEIYLNSQSAYNRNRLHGKIKAKFGAAYLRKNQELLQ